MRKLGIVAVCVGALYGCGSDLSQCPSPDLEKLGREEALAGLPAALPKAGCVPKGADLAAYERGRAQGLERYCTAARGYALALDGKTVDPALCADSLAAELKRGAEVGKELRHHLSERDQLVAQATDIERIAADLPEDSEERRKLEDQAAGLRFDARQRDNDVEALRGIAAVERWQ